MKIVVGTTSSHKLQAVSFACENVNIDDADISGVKTSSGVNEQPVGLEETFRGAFNRADSAKKADGSKDAIYIGIESGIISIGAFPYLSFIDLAVIVVLFGDSQRFITATSSGISFPMEYVDEAQSRGFRTTTVGSVIAEKTGCDGTDPHWYLTQGVVSRMVTLIQALSIALSQL